MKRRSFIKWSSLFAFTGLTSLAPTTGSKAQAPQSLIQTGSNDRLYWVNLLDKISSPVLQLMNKAELRKKMPMEYSPTWDGRNKEVGYLECFGRLIAGLAPFLALPEDQHSTEGQIRKRLLQQSQQSLAQAVDPKSPDYLFDIPNTPQVIVDTAYIAQALLAAPDVLWHPLDPLTKKRIIYELVRTRKIKPFNSNWLLFGAIIESFLLSIDQEIDSTRIDHAVDKINSWYVGDGWYKDGEKFAFDHYNGFVIQPMLIEVLKIDAAKNRRSIDAYNLAYKRMQRYASFQERYISPEGTFLVVGRSSTYRVGVFQPLAKLALDNALPKNISPAQVRCGLTAVFKNVFISSSFTKGDWLTLGFVGDQQTDMADYYSNTGSMYITSLAFLPLGLPASDSFWADPYTDWTQKKIWSGQSVEKDYAVKY